MKRIIVALPTCGKTYACKQLNSLGDFKAVDLDIRGSKFLRSSEATKALTEYAKVLLNTGCNILFTHNGAIDFTLIDPQDVMVDVVVRNGPASAYAAMCRKRGDSERFACEAFDNFESWVNGMWKLFDYLTLLGFHTRVILLGSSGGYIWDYLSPELYKKHCDC